MNKKLFAFSIVTIVALFNGLLAMEKKNPVDPDKNMTNIQRLEELEKKAQQPDITEKERLEIQNAILEETHNFLENDPNLKGLRETVAEVAVELRSKKSQRKSRCLMQ